MKLYKTQELRPSQLEKIYNDLGGTYSFWERMRRSRVGSPMMFYLEGDMQLDTLQDLATDELRINFELLKEGILIRIAERTNSYFFSISSMDILAIDLSKDKTKSYLKVSINPSYQFQLWGSIDQYYGWRDFIKNSFLANYSTNAFE